MYRVARNPAAGARGPAGAALVGARPRARRQVTRDRCIRLLDNIRLLEQAQKPEQAS